MFADEIRRKRVEPMRAYSNWQRHMDEVFLKVIVSGTTSDAWLVTVAGHESEVLRSYGAAMKEVGNADKRETGRWLNSRAEKSQASGWRLALLRPH
jgi:putative transposase